MTSLQIIGRRSSLFTRLPLIFAEELGVAYQFVPIFDMTRSEPAIYAGNPALKLPILRDGGDVLFGAENICRALVAHATRTYRILWPEALVTPDARNAQELIWHGMASQVQLIMGTIVNSLPVDDPYFQKVRAGFEGALAWLDSHVPALLAGLPARDLSVLEASLFCLVEHLRFRETLPLAPYPTLSAFAVTYGERAAAQATAYRFDVQ